MKKHQLLICFAALALWHVPIKAQTYDTLSNFGATWKYLDDGSDQDATSWKSPTYSDATWKCGPSPIGYGDTWIVTCIQSGCVNDITCAPQCGTKNITNWFRQVINVPSVSLYDSVVMDALVDDGMILYVNDSMIWNYNMPASWNYTTWAPTIIEGSAETTLVHISIPTTHWVNGNNTVAVELHQRGPTSSDADLDIRFLFRRTNTSSVNSIPDNGIKFDMYPNPSNGEFTIAASDPAVASTEMRMTVADVTGRKLIDQPITFTGGKSTLNLILQNGVYFINIVSQNTNTTFKINIIN
jgi:hypothetical protein